MPSKADYKKKSVKDLTKDCKGRKLPKGKECPKKKDDLADFLAALDAAVVSPAKTKKSKSSKSSSPTLTIKPSKTPAAKPTKLKFVCDEQSCPDDEVCVLGSGKCVKRTKTGKKTPLLSDLSKVAGIDSKTYKSDYEFDPELGVLGLKEHVDEYRKLKPVVAPKPILKAPAKAKKTSSKKCYQPDADDCDAGKVCSFSGACIQDKPAARKGKFVLVLETGRQIIGTKEKLEALKLKGKIYPADAPLPTTKKSKTVKVATPPSSPEESTEDTSSDEEGEEAESEAERKAREEIERKAAKASKTASKTAAKEEAERERARLAKKALQEEEAKKAAARKEEETRTRVATEKLTTVELKKKEIQDTFKACLARLD